MPTIFDGIVRKENDYTNLLKSLLERDPIFAAAVLTYLLDRDVTESEAFSFSCRTQQRFTQNDELMIPDLVIEGANLYCIIEIKTGYSTETQTSQEQGYVNCFSGGREEYFIFLVPEDWKDTSKVENVKKACQLRSICAHKRTWQGLVKAISEKTVQVSDDVLKEAVSFLCESFEVFNVKSEELASLATWRETYGAFRKVERTIDQAQKIFRAHGFEIEAETSDLNAYGFYIKRNGKYRLWIGLWTDANSVLSYGYHLKKSEWDKPTHEREGGSIIKDHHLWSLPDDVFANSQQVFDTVRAMHNQTWAEGGL